ncbi:MAG: hypothetical protein Q4C49_06690 [Bacillota bacterium]|nr:hypothetical protein [Bacillota bacterium]
MKKRSWLGIVFALFILFLYIMGTYDLPMMLGHNEAYYLSKGYGESAIQYFTNYPLYLLVFWIVNLACGLISPILYLIKNTNAYKVAFLSAIADFVLIVLGVLLRNRIVALGIQIFCFDLFILVVTALFGIYLYKQR